MSEVVHDRMPCGIEYGVVHLPRRHVVAVQLRVLAGASTEPEDKLGLAHLVEETIDKGSARRTGRELSDAFDAIGASRRSGTGRETCTFTFTVLPEHFERAVELHAELLREPAFPDDAFRVNVDLAKQELSALEDDAQGVVDRLISRQAYGDILGRHPLGESRTLDRITREDLVGFWRQSFHNERMLLSAAGPIDAQRVAGAFERYFTGFNGVGSARAAFPLTFTPGATHRHKELEQQQIGICWPGVAATHDDFPIQQVILGILSGGMSGRLFTEVREKQGLVYWVAAWQENPRGAAMIFLGASTTPERCDRTYATLLREVDRLAEDIEQDEVDRVITSILAQRETRGESTRARCSELSDDLFHYGRPVSDEEKAQRIARVNVGDVRRYLNTYPRSPRCVVTLGPRALEGVN